MPFCWINFYLTGESQPFCQVEVYKLSLDTSQIHKSILKFSKAPHYLLLFLPLFHINDLLFAATNLINNFAHNSPLHSSTWSNNPASLCKIYANRQVQEESPAKISTWFPKEKLIKRHANDFLVFVNSQALQN